jgi:hypothetical protein
MIAHQSRGFVDHPVRLEHRENREGKDSLELQVR